MGVRTGKEVCVNVSSSIHFSLSWWSTVWLFQNLIYSECMSDVAGVSAFALYMPLKITKINDSMATIMITMNHQLTHEFCAGFPKEEMVNRWFSLQLAQQNEFMLLFR